MDRLTDVDYWEEQFWKGQRPQRLRLYRDFDFETVRLLRSAAAGRKNVRALEMGAGGSRVLPYLARKFGFRVFGSDFSPAGLRLLRANLALEEVDGGVVREDLFQSSLAPASFDLVFSSGLVEHFEDTAAVVAEHLRLVKPGGSLVVIVPNLQGFYARILKRLALPLLSRHRIFGPAELAGIFEKLGVAQVRAGYLGSFYVHVGRDADWPGVQRWPRWLQYVACASVRLVNGVISFFFRLSPLHPRGRALSPAFYAAGKKR